MAVINTNYSSVIVQNDLTVTSRTLSSAMEQLSTGKRINSAVDDASGLSMSNSRAMQIKGLNQSIRNANDGVSMLQTADGALSEVNSLLNRMRELAIQAGNDTNTSKDRYALDQEYQQLNREISRIATNTQWNGMNVLNTTEVGAPGTSSDVSSGVRNVKFHVGANSNQYLNIGLKDFSYNLGVPAQTSEAKFSLGDLKGKQYFQFSIQGSSPIGFSTTRAIENTVMTDEQLLDFETAMNRAITNTDNYSNVSVTRVGSDIYVKDAEGRSMGGWALTGGATAATANEQLRITESGAVATNVLTYSETISISPSDLTSYTSFTVQKNGAAISVNYNFSTGSPTLSGLATSIQSALGTGYSVQAIGNSLKFDTNVTTAGGNYPPSNLRGVVGGSSYLIASNLASPVTYDDYVNNFSVGDLTGKKYFSIGLGSTTYSFEYDYAAGSISGFASAIQDKLNTSVPANTYVVTAVNNDALKVTWNWASPATLNVPTRLTSGSDVSTRGLSADYQGSVISQGALAVNAGTPASTSVFSGSARLNDTRITTHAGATVAIGRIDAAMAAVDREQTSMGSVMNRLTHAGDNAGQISRNTTSSRSRLSDADYAAATTEVVRQQIMQQAGMAMLAQASQVPNSVITLLK